MRPRKYNSEWDRIRNLRYQNHKSVAKQRGIDFQLTFEEWWEVWQSSGRWDQRGASREKYVMSRIGDVGPYAVGNVVIQLHSDNIRQAHYGNTHSKGKVAWNKGIPRTEDVKQRISDKTLGRPRIVPLPKEQCKYCDMITTTTNIKRWHNEKCKSKPVQTLSIASATTKTISA